MEEFTPITTQEQFDSAIGERLRRERESVAKKYGDYDALKTKVADYESQIGTMSKTMEESAKKYEGYDKTLSELQAKIKGYETSSVKMRIAHETGLPYELGTRLSGETEDEIRKDAEALAKIVGEQSTRHAPLKSSESGGGDSKQAALKQMLQEMKG